MFDGRWLLDSDFLAVGLESMEKTGCVDDNATTRVTFVDGGNVFNDSATGTQTSRVKFVAGTCINGVEGVESSGNSHLKGCNEFRSDCNVTGDVDATVNTDGTCSGADFTHGVGMVKGMNGPNFGVALGSGADSTMGAMNDEAGNKKNEEAACFKMGTFGDDASSKGPQMNSASFSNILNSESINKTINF
ncbi:hypothetical protein Tco_0145390 [Tanacetum coccineum]